MQASTQQLWDTKKTCTQIWKDKLPHTKHGIHTYTHTNTYMCTWTTISSYKKTSRDDKVTYQSSSLCSSKNSTICLCLNSLLYSLYFWMASVSSMLSSCWVRNCLKDNMVCFLEPCRVPVGDSARIALERKMREGSECACIECVWSKCEEYVWALASYPDSSPVKWRGSLEDLITCLMMYCNSRVCVVLKIDTLPMQSGSKYCPALLC